MDIGAAQEQSARPTSDWETLGNASQAKVKVATSSAKKNLQDQLSYRRTRLIRQLAKLDRLVQSLEYATENDCLMIKQFIEQLEESRLGL